MTDGHGWELRAGLDGDGDGNVNDDHDVGHHFDGDGDVDVDDEEVNDGNEGNAGRTFVS